MERKIFEIGIDEDTKVKMKLQLLVDGKVENEVELDKIMGIYIDKNECDEKTISTNFISAGVFGFEEMVAIKKTWKERFPEIAAQNALEQIMKEIEDME